MKVSVKFSVRPIYLPLWQVQGKRYVIVMGGRGAGRSTAVSQYITSRIPAEEYMRCALMRSVHADIRHSSWAEISDRIDEKGIREAIGMHIADNNMRLEYGQNSIQAHGFRAASGSHKAKLKSLASYNVVWIEEAEEIGEEEFRTLDDTLRTVKGNIIIIFSLNPPAKSHWMIDRFFDLEPAYLNGLHVDGFYKPVLKASAKNVLYIPGNFRDNLPNLAPDTIQQYEKYRETKPSYYWQMIEGLVPEVVRGKIYSGWRQIEEVPFNARHVANGLDFGWFPDPACLVSIYYHDGGYIIDELAYGNEIPNPVISQRILALEDTVLTIADSAEPKSIAEIAGQNVQIIGSEKGKDSVEFGIKTVSNLKISVTKRSRNVWKSYENYAWKEDKDGNSLGIPVHDYSHAMDAIRYPLVFLNGTMDTTNKRAEQNNNMLRNQHRQTHNDTR